MPTLPEPVSDGVGTGPWVSDSSLSFPHTNSSSSAPTETLLKIRMRWKRQGCTQTDGGALKGNRKAVFLSHTPSNCLTGSPWEMPCFCDFLNLLIYFFLLFVCAVEHMGTLVPRPGINPCPLHWKCRVSITGWPGKSHFCGF